MTLEELRAKYPDEIAQAEAAARAAVDHTEAVNAAVQAERERMQEIDEVASLLDPADVREAKYGEKPCTAADLVMAEARKAGQEIPVRPQGRCRRVQRRRRWRNASPC